MPVAQPPTSLSSVNLVNVSVPLAVLSTIPLEVVEKYQVAAFEATNEVLKLAIVHPEQLKQGFYTALEDMGKKINRKIELYRTDFNSIRAVINQYKGQALKSPSLEPVITPPPTALEPKSLAAGQSPFPVPPPISPNSSPVLVSTPVAVQPPPPFPQKPTESTSAPLPTPPPAVTSQPLAPVASALEKPVSVADSAQQQAVPPPPLFELGKTVAFNYLKRIPLDFAVTHRLLCVDHLQPNIYWFVTDGSLPHIIDTTVPTIAKTNKLVAHTICIDRREIDKLLNYYRDMVKEEQRGKQGDDFAEEKAEKKPEIDLNLKATSPAAPLQQGEVKLAQGVVVPNAQGSILSTEEERGGLAGFFQKVTQNFTVNKEEIPEQKLEPLPLPKVETPAPASVSVPVAASGQPAPAETSASATPDIKVTPVEVTAEAKADKENKKNAEQPSDGDIEIGKLLSKEVETVDELKDYIRKGSIPLIVAAVVNFAIHEKASDIHVEVFDDEVRVRYRVDGQLVDVVKLPPDLHAAMVSRIKILARLRLDESRVPQDGRFDVNFNNAQVDLRVSLMPTIHGEKVVMRILDKSKGVASMEKLGILGLGYENLTKAINKPFGICLATGPTGSGKSTSLYAILNRIATPNVNVITLEDPVEFEMKGINQSQIRPKIGFTFAEGLRSILRQDPNIIMVGEIRDGETANMATQAALTGHLVLSTLHTNDAAGAIPRLSNMGIEPFLITSSLNVAVGQRLVRKICPDCKQVVSMPDGIKEQIGKDIEVIAALNPIDAKRITQPYTFYQGRGCSSCGGKGYQGRLGIYEVLLMSEGLEDLTLKHASGSEIQAQAQKEGMVTMYQDGILKVLAGLTTLDEVLRETSNK